VFSRQPFLGVLFEVNKMAIRGYRALLSDCSSFCYLVSADFMNFVTGFITQLPTKLNSLEIGSAKFLLKGINYFYL
jgi:hypothetical protein